MYFTLTWLYSIYVVLKLSSFGITIVLKRTYLLCLDCGCREGKQRWFAWKVNHDSCSAIPVGRPSCFWNTSLGCSEWGRDCRENLLAMGFFVNKLSNSLVDHHLCILYIKLLYSNSMYKILMFYSTLDCLELCDALLGSSHWPL